MRNVVERCKKVSGERARFSCSGVKDKVSGRVRLRSMIKFLKCFLPLKDSCKCYFSHKQV